MGQWWKLAPGPLNNLRPALLKHYELVSWKEPFKTLRGKAEEKNPICNFRWQRELFQEEKHIFIQLCLIFPVYTPLCTSNSIKSIWCVKVIINKTSFIPVRGAKHITVNVFHVNHTISNHKYFTFTTFHHNGLSNWRHWFHQSPDKMGGLLRECFGGTMSQLLQVLPPKKHIITLVTEPHVNLMTAQYTRYALPPPGWKAPTRNKNESEHPPGFESVADLSGINH